MDPELKTLLTRLLNKIEVLESRLKAVEAKTHDQVKVPFWTHWGQIEPVPFPETYERYPKRSKLNNVNDSKVVRPMHPIC